jgi:hypothetical protein
MLVMRRLCLILQLVTAIAAAMLAVSFRLQNLLSPNAAELDRLVVVALVAVVALSAGGVLLWRNGNVTGRSRAAISGLLIALTLLSGFAPGAVDLQRRAAVETVRQLEAQRREQAFARELREWTDQIDGNVATLRPLTTAQAWAFIDFVSRAGRYDDGAVPPSAQALALLRKALISGRIDVNAPVQGLRLSDTAPRPLFLQFYKEQVEPVRRAGALAGQDWTIMQLLATSGANLSRPDAAPLAADLTRTVVPGAGRYVSLQ